MHAARRAWHRACHAGHVKPKGSYAIPLWECLPCGCRHFRVIYTRLGCGGKLIRRRVYGIGYTYRTYREIDAEEI